MNSNWVGAGHLKIGDNIKQADGTTGVVANLVTVEQTQEMFSLTVSEAHTFYVGNSGWLVHNQAGLGPVPYGTGISQYAVYECPRLGLLNAPNRNVAVFVLKGFDEPLIFLNTPGGNHSEVNGMLELKRRGLLDQVTEIYSERSPCTGQGCSAMIKGKFPNLQRVTYSFEYDMGATAAERKASQALGNRLLADALKGSCWP